MALFSKRNAARRIGNSKCSQGKRFRPVLEAMDERLVPSVTIQEDTSAHTLTLTAGDHQSNTITIRNDGDGGLRIVADGVVRNFTGIKGVTVKTGDRADTVTYNQGTSGQEVDLQRDFTLNVELGDNASGTLDRFTANVFGDVGFSQNGEWQARTLAFLIEGNDRNDLFQADGRDRIDINVNHDTDVRPGSQLYLRLHGGDSNDNITVDYDGRMDGKLNLLAAGEAGADTVAVNAQLDTGSSGKVVCSDNPGGAAIVMGNYGNDNLTFAVRLASGATAQVSAIVDGGIFEDDTGRHTTNVSTAHLEHDFVIQ
jgi:hypothetical protein